MSFTNNINIDKKFTQLDNNIINNMKMSWREKGLLSYLISKPSGWEFSADRIANDGVDGVRSVRSSLKILIKTGWLTRKKLVTGKINYILDYGDFALFDYESQDLSKTKSKVLQAHSAESAGISNKDKNKYLNNKVSKETPLEKDSEGTEQDDLNPAKKKIKLKYTKKDKKIAKLHYKEVLAANPRTTIKFDKDKWADAVRKLREIDKYTSGEIHAALEFARQDNFWEKNSQSIPALRNRSSRNNKLKFENLFKAYEDSKQIPASVQTKKEEFDPVSQWGDDTRCIKICDNLTSCLKDSFTDEKKISELVNLVELIDHMTASETTMWRSHREGSPVLFSRGSMYNTANVRDEDAYPTFFNDVEKMKGYVGFKSLKLGSEVFSKFEDWVCKNMPVTNWDAKATLMNKSCSSSAELKENWDIYIENLSEGSDNHYFTYQLPVKRSKK